MPTNLPTIILDRIGKSFADNKVLGSVSLSVRQGEIYALIGPNGSGKTTLVKIMVGLLAADTGTAKIMNHNIATDPLKTKSSFGYVSDSPAGYDFLTGYEFLSLTANLKQVHHDIAALQIKNLSKLFPIADVLSQPMSNYSRGNLQKVSFLSSLIGSPKVLIIDEPVVGLDPGSIDIFGEKLRSFATAGGTVFIVTHTLSFAKTYATRFGLLSSGSLVIEGDIKPSLDLDEIYRNKVLHE